MLQSCGIYTFSGISLPPAVKNFSVQFQNKTSDGPADLSEQLQTQLAAEVVRRIARQQVDDQGDLRWTGTITCFSYQPGVLSINSDGEQERQSLLSVVMEVTYVNIYDKKSSFSKKYFSAYADMPADGDRAEEEPQLVQKILGQLINDILRATVANW